MGSSIFGASVQGSSHKRTDPPTRCQDSCSKDNEFILDDGTIIMAVADGHGSKECKYSHLGSQYAVETFYGVMKYYHEKYGKPLDYLYDYLRNDGRINVAQDIDTEWKKKVLDRHTKSNRYTPESDNKETRNNNIYRLYGSTLIGLMITPSFLFAYQLGDGDITYIDNDCSPKEVITGDKFLGTDTHSLSGKESWKKAITYIRRRDSIKSIPHMFLLSTDGFSNSHKNEQEFHKTCIDYFEMIKEHGPDVVKSNLKKWLTETSEQGCGDDVTLLIAYFYDALIKTELITVEDASEEITGTGDTESE